MAVRSWQGTAGHRGTAPFDRFDRCTALARQATRFALAGFSATVANFVLLTLLHEGVGWDAVAANVPAYGAGIVVSYGLNRAWTFRHTIRRNVLRQGLQFCAVSLCGLALQTLLFATALQAGLEYFPAFVLSTALVFFWNFPVNRTLTFRLGVPVKA